MVYCSLKIKIIKNKKKKDKKSRIVLFNNYTHYQLLFRLIPSTSNYTKKKYTHFFFCPYLFNEVTTLCTYTRIQLNCFNFIDWKNNDKMLKMH